jgi:hypothetical protein
MNPIFENQPTTTALAKAKEITLLKRKLEVFQSESINDLKQEIEGKQRNLESFLSSISGKDCPIQTKEYLLGLFSTFDVEKTFIKVYGDIKTVTTKTGEAINTNFSISMSILDLLRKLANYELDLYNIIDESELSSAELADLFRDVFKEDETTDETVIQLFEQTKKRALLLRDRIEALRLEFEDELNKKSCEYDDSISKQNSKIKALESDLDKRIDNLNKRISEQGLSIHNQKERLQSISKASESSNTKLKKWVILGGILTFTISLIGSVLIHLFL